MRKNIKNNFLTFVDIDFHKKTKSGNFLFDLLSKYFLTNFVWVKSKNNNFIFDAKSNKLKENIFFFQYLPNLLDLFRLRKKTIFWAPMYDDAKSKNFFFWLIVLIFNVKVISFSRKISNICKNYKIKFLYLKYFPNIKKFKTKKNNSKVTVFFWYRGTIKLTDWLNCIKSNDIKKINYYNLKDPNFSNEKISNTVIKKYKIKIHHGKYGKTESLYNNLIKDSDIYVAPREREGIGHSFLEAMSQGKYILSKKEETMSEYISSNKIGCFFDYKINLKNINNFFYERINYSKKLSTKWNVSKINLIKYILINQKNIL